MAYSSLVRGVRQNRGGHGDSWGHVSGSWCRQAFVGKTDVFMLIPLIALAPRDT